MTDEELKKWGQKFKDFFMCNAHNLTEKQKEELWKYIRWQWEKDNFKKNENKCLACGNFHGAGIACPEMMIT